MTVLSDKDIRSLIAKDKLVVEPVNLDKQLQPASLDIRLGGEFSQYATKKDEISTNDDVAQLMATWHSNNGVTVNPDSFILANTVEEFEIPENVGAEIRGRSSVGRLGLEVHSCAGWCDPGFEGELVLEISNNSEQNVHLESGMRIAQMVFYTLSSSPINTYGETDNKYQHQEGAVASKIDEDE